MMIYPLLILLRLNLFSVEKNFYLLILFSNKYISPSDFLKDTLRKFDTSFVRNKHVIN